MRMRGSDSVALVSAVKQAIDCRREREQLRMREEALNESRKRVVGEGEPDVGPGVVLVLVALPDSRKSTMKRRFVLDAPARLLFDATDVFMADKCALDLKDGFHLQVSMCRGRQQRKKRRNDKSKPSTSTSDDFRHI